MGHSKAFLLEDMRRKAGEIMAVLVGEDVSIKPDHLLLEDGDIDHLKITFIRPGFYWIRGVYEEEYEEVNKIKKLLPDHLWARYKSWGGFDEHREVVLLKDALIKLRAKVVSRDRPDIFKKSKRAKEIRLLKTKTAKTTS